MYKGLSIELPGEQLKSFRLKKPRVLGNFNLKVVWNRLFLVDSIGTKYIYPSCGFACYNMTSRGVAYEL